MLAVVLPFQLPPGFELMASDRPLLDLYAGVPWAWPDDLTRDLQRRIGDLVADERSTRLVLHDGPRQFRRPVAAIVPELDELIGFLFGTGAVRIGAWARPEAPLLAPWRTTRPAMFGALTWSAAAVRWRPPGGGPLISAAGDDPGLREMALGLLLDSVRAFEGIEPLEPRRRALLSLLEKADARSVDAFRTARFPEDRELVEELWASSASESSKEALPELTGPTGYLDWVFREWREVHERLVRQVDGGHSIVDAFAGAARVAGLRGLPIELAAVADEFFYIAAVSAYEEDLRLDPAGRSLEVWRARSLRWLENGLGEGHLADCRLWIDRSIRLIQCLAGFPGQPCTVENQFMPVVAFHRKARERLDRRTVRCEPVEEADREEQMWTRDIPLREAIGSPGSSGLTRPG